MVDTPLIGPPLPPRMPAKPPVTAPGTDKPESAAGTAETGDTVVMRSDPYEGTWKAYDAATARDGKKLSHDQFIAKMRDLAVKNGGKFSKNDLQELFGLNNDKLKLTDSAYLAFTGKNDTKETISLDELKDDLTFFATYSQITGVSLEFFGQCEVTVVSADVLMDHLKQLPRADLVKFVKAHRSYLNSVIPHVDPKGGDCSDLSDDALADRIRDNILTDPKKCQSFTLFVIAAMSRAITEEKMGFPKGLDEPVAAQYFAKTAFNDYLMGGGLNKVTLASASNFAGKTAELRAYLKSNGQEALLDGIDPSKPEHKAALDRSFTLLPGFLRGGKIEQIVGILTGLTATVAQAKTTPTSR